MAHSIDRTIHYVHSFMIERSVIFYYSATFNGTCAIAALPQIFRPVGDVTNLSESTALVVCLCATDFCCGENKKNGKGILFYMCLPNSVKRKTLIKNRSDRCKNEENRTDGELKLMVFTTSFCTLRTWRATHNFDTAIKIFLPIVPILAWRTSSYMSPRSTHARHARVRGAVPIHLNRNVGQVNHGFLRWTILSFWISLTYFYFFIEWAPLNIFHQAGPSSQAITSPPSELLSWDTVAIMYNHPQYIGKTIHTRHWPIPGSIQIR